MEQIRSEQAGTVLLAENEPEACRYFQTALRCYGYQTETVDDGEQVLACLERGAPLSAVLLDMALPRKNGMETLRAIRRVNRNIPVIMVSGAASPLNIVEAMKSGADEFLGKPVRHEELLEAIKRTRDTPSPTPVVGPAPAVNASVYFGASPRMRELQAMLRQVALSEAPVLITGETGTGKEVLARQVHAMSARARQTLRRVNCAGLTAATAESELFGYERDVFTGVLRKQPGIFDQAAGGTILLDEIGDTDFNLQGSLLSAFSDREFHGAGRAESTPADVRVIATSHHDLEALLKENRFRADLYYRLNVASLHVPALRERKEDIPPLTDFLVRRHSRPGTSTPPITPALREALLVYDWPGNVRELENIVRRLLIMGNPEGLAQELQMKAGRPAVVPVAVGNPVPAAVGATILEEVDRARQRAETDAILAALESTRWNRRKAAVQLQIEYKALLYRMKKLHIEKPSGPLYTAAAGAR